MFVAAQDDFFDRTGNTRRERKQKKVDAATNVINAQSVWAQQQLLQLKKQRIQRQIVEEELRQQELKALGPDAETGTKDAQDVDALDAFMQDVSTTIEEDKVKVLRKELDGLKHEQQRLMKLMELVDPMKFFQVNR